MAEKNEKISQQDLRVETNSPAVVAQKKKTNKTVLIIVVIVLVLFVGLPILATTLLWNTIGSKYFGIVKTSTNGNVSLDLGGGNKVSLNADKSQEWPSSLPAEIPRYTGGKISGVAKFGETWTITVTNTSDADYTSYVARLKSVGFTMSESLAYGGIQSDGGTKGEWRVSATLSTDDSGAKSLLLSFVKESPQPDQAQ